METFKAGDIVRHASTRVVSTVIAARGDVAWITCGSGTYIEDVCCLQHEPLKKGGKVALKSNSLHMLGTVEALTSREAWVMNVTGHCYTFPLDALVQFQP